jgi:hypothetical protein
MGKDRTRLCLLVNEEVEFDIKSLKNSYSVRLHDVKINKNLLYNLLYCFIIVNLYLKLETDKFTLS